MAWWLQNQCQQAVFGLLESWREYYRCRDPGVSLTQYRWLVAACIQNEMCNQVVMRKLDTLKNKGTAFSQVIECPRWTSYLEYLYQIIQYFVNIIKPWFPSEWKERENDESEPIEGKLVQERKCVVISLESSLSLRKALDGFTVIIACGVPINVDQTDENILIVNSACWTMYAVLLYNEWTKLRRQKSLNIQLG